MGGETDRYGAGPGFEPELHLPNIIFPEPPHFPPVTREALSLLRIEAELCPFVVCRALLIFAERDATPYIILVERGVHVQRIEIETHVPATKAGLCLLHAVRRIPNLRSAHLLAIGERMPALPLSAKMRDPMFRSDRITTRRLGETERQRLLAQHPLWLPLAERDAIRRRFRFADFAEAFGFISAVAIVSEGMDHHPEWSNIFDQVEIVLTTHALDGLSVLDAELARRIDELALLFGANSAG